MEEKSDGCRINFCGNRDFTRQHYKYQCRYLSEQCAALGLSCYYQVTVGDNEARLKAAVREALTRSDVIILTGGLGRPMMI